MRTYEPIFGRIYPGDDRRTWDKTRKPHPDAFWTNKYGWCHEADPCPEGRYDGHWHGQYIEDRGGERRQYRIWCPGAGIGDSDGP